MLRPFLFLTLGAFKMNFTFFGTCFTKMMFYGHSTAFMTTQINFYVGVPHINLLLCADVRMYGCAGVRMFVKTFS